MNTNENTAPETVADYCEAFDVTINASTKPQAAFEHWQRDKEDTPDEAGEFTLEHFAAYIAELREDYDEAVLALADELGEDPADLTEERHTVYGLTVYSIGRAEYAVGTDAEADEAWDQALDSYLDECGVLDNIPENLRQYFNRDAWKRDARFDGRGHALASYDGDELELAGDFYAFRIN
jgi:tetratricopeptide (TPR) repeat protein